ncbi:hypothetical protein PTKIN_Ptkin17bG0125200 [Pterospermum kingtungense]
MTLWKRATGAIKDRNSIVVANFSKKCSFRNPDLEAAIIKATSHDEDHIDKRSAQMVFSWIRASPISLRPLVWALSRRMEKTQSWVVAIKGLMLMHGVFHCKAPVVQKMGRLPFDLSSFSDGHFRSSKKWGFNAFIRDYFAFLDQRAVVSFEQDYQKGDGRRSLMVQQLVKVQKWQSLLDLLLQIRPRADNMKVRLVLEAMDCVILEISDVYSRICREISNVLVKIHSAGKVEADMAMKVLEMARAQGEELYLFFEFCKEYGILNAYEIPRLTQISDEDVRKVEMIIDGDLGKTCKEEEIKQNNTMAMVVREEHKAVVEQRESKEGLKTIITDIWVVFDENTKINGENNGLSNEKKTAASDLPPLVAIDDEPAVYNRYEIPDLISF